MSYLLLASSLLFSFHSEQPVAAEPPPGMEAKTTAVRFPSHVIDPSTGTRFATDASVGGTKYTCLGAGVRKVLFFKAYAVSFCLEKSQVAKAVDTYVERVHPKLEGKELVRALERDRAFFDGLASSPGDKLVIMQLVRNISKDQIASAFRDSLGEVLPNDRVEKLIATIPGDGKKGQQILLHSHGNVLVIDIAGDAKRLDDELISKNLWKVWLGPGAVAPSLEKSIAETVATSR